MFLVAILSLTPPPKRTGKIIEKWKIVANVSIDSEKWMQ
ncbi:MAG: hypothetical protein AMDU1_APLC00007G0010 [Thermoplasmatales archaeon A-plasma]|nr:MAG: hypothetical protein AMDU1_APLC00007G0010 [Thermoplasmatales archaeon A-plasma]